MSAERASRQTRLSASALAMAIVLVGAGCGGTGDPGQISTPAAPVDTSRWTTHHGRYAAVGECNIEFRFPADLMRYQIDPWLDQAPEQRCEASLTFNDSYGGFSLIIFPNDGSTLTDFVQRDTAHIAIEGRISEKIDGRAAERIVGKADQGTPGGFGILDQNADLVRLYIADGRRYVYAQYVRDNRIVTSTISDVAIYEEIERSIHFIDSTNGVR